MKNLKIKVISKYLRPYKKEFFYGALALLLVNILSVVIPLEVKNIIDQLQNGFSSEFVISKSLWLIFLATCMGLIRLFSRQIVFDEDLPLLSFQFQRLSVSRIVLLSPCRLLKKLARMTWKSQNLKRNRFATGQLCF